MSSRKGYVPPTLKSVGRTYATSTLSLPSKGKKGPFNSPAPQKSKAKVIASNKTADKKRKANPKLKKNSSSKKAPKAARTARLKNHKWTIDEDVKLYTEYGSGFEKLSKVAKEIGISAPSCLYRFKTLKNYFKHCTTGMSVPTTEVVTIKSVYMNELYDALFARPIAPVTTDSTASTQVLQQQ
jgi:hypothetical protein